MAGKADNTKGRGAYLPTLPEGWTYTISVTGPEPHKVVVCEHDTDGWVVIFTDDSGQRKGRAGTLHEALRSLGRGVRALVQVEKDEAALKAAREAALATLGEPLPGMMEGIQ